MTKNISLLLLALLVGLLITIYMITTNNSTQPEARSFDGERAFNDVEYQVELGPRVPTSQAHAQVISWLEQELALSGWDPKLQLTTVMNHPMVNIIGSRKAATKNNYPWIILGAHYDSRLYADRDPKPELRIQAVPGANDGASGVAVLLELARVIPEDIPLNIWLVFFDGEDNGNIPGWDWILGSSGFVNILEGKPAAVVIVDMIGDRDLNIYFEKNSDLTLSNEIWFVAQDLGYSSHFIPLEKHRILDDHIPFLDAGIIAADIIDFDYPPWHTTEDTIDKISANSLEVVGDTLYHWIIQRAYGRGIPTP